MVFRIGGLQQHNAVLRVQLVFHTLQSGHGLTGVHTNTRHDAHTLRLDEDLAFLAFLIADHMAKGIVKVVYPR